MDDWQYTFPKLEGTATVEMVVDGEIISIEVNAEDAPVTASNFIDLVEDGFYDGLMFHRVEEGFVAQGGDPQSLEIDDPEELGGGGFIDPDTDEERTIPLEIKPEGAEEPIYSQTFDDAGIEEEPELPHTQGAIAMARTNDPDSASSQFYFALEDLQQLDGSYAVFGYVDEGIDFLDDIEEGDIITSAKVVEGTPPERDSELMDSDLLNYFVNNDNKFTVEVIANSVEDSEETTDPAAEETELEPDEEATDDSEETTDPVAEETESEPEEEAADDSEETTDAVTEETEPEEEEAADSEVDSEDDAVASGETEDEGAEEEGLVASQIADEVAEDDTDDVAEDDTDEVAEDDTDEVAEDDIDEVAEDDTDDVAEDDTDEVAEDDTDEVAEDDADEVAEDDADEAAEDDIDEVAEDDIDEVAEDDTDDDADDSEEEEVADESDNTIEMSSVELESNAIAALKGDDEVSGTDDGDIINGNEGDDVINGLAGGDWLRGGKGDDILIGGRGDDFLVADFGSDSLTGGLGADTFILRTETAEGIQDVDLAHWILDFNNLEEGDRIAIVSDDFTLEDLSFDLDGENTLITLTESGDILGVVENTPTSIFDSPETVISVIPEDDVAMQLG